MRKKAPGHRSLASTVWALTRTQGRLVAFVGSFSTDDKARSEAAKIIASEAGIRNLRLPIWTPKAEGFELIYGRDDQSWQFTVLPSIVDGASV